MRRRTSQRLPDNGATTQGGNHPAAGPAAGTDPDTDPALHRQETEETEETEETDKTDETEEPVTSGGARVRVYCSI